MKKSVTPAFIFFLFTLIFHYSYSQFAPSYEWAKCFGGSYPDYGEFVCATNDGGYLIVGSSASNNGDVSGHHGSNFSYDCWIAKINSGGNLQWQHSYGGTLTDLGRSVIQLSDSNYMVLSYAYSSDFDVTGNHGLSDLWLMKLDTAGNILWNKCYGGSGEDFCWDLIQTSDNGFLMTGATRSSDGDITGHHNNVDGWIVKIDSSGTLLWQKDLGGSADEYFYHSIEMADGSFLSVGFTGSSNGDISDLIGVFDVWVVKLSVTGSLIWEKTSVERTRMQDRALLRFPEAEQLSPGKPIQMM